MAMIRVDEETKRRLLAFREELAAYVESANIPGEPAFSSGDAILKVSDDYILNQAIARARASIRQ